MLIENSYRGFIIGNNFIYFGVEGDGPFHPNAEIKANGDIYIASLDTFESRLLCHVEEVKPYAIASSYLNVLLSGDWVALHYTHEKSSEPADKNGVMSDMIIVNMETGEYHISEYRE